MEKLNIDYTAVATNTGGRKGHVKTDDGLIDLKSAMPKEIGGEGGKPIQNNFLRLDMRLVLVVPLGAVQAKSVCEILR